MSTLSIILSVVSVIFLLYIIRLYNNLIGVKNEITKMMGSIDAILKKRFDLIPNLVSTVKEYSVFERALLEEITALRSAAFNPYMTPGEKASISDSMSGVLRQFALTVENYPALQANQSFMHLQRTIAILEEELSAARRVYNQSVTDYNNECEMFPSNIVAGLMRLPKVDVFKATLQEQSLPSMSAEFSK